MERQNRRSKAGAHKPRTEIWEEAGGSVGFGHKLVSPSASWLLYTCNAAQSRYTSHLHTLTIAIRCKMVANTPVGPPKRPILALLSVVLVLLILERAVAEPAPLKMNADGTFKIIQFTDLHFAKSKEVMST